MVADRHGIPHVVVADLANAVLYDNNVITDENIAIYPHKVTKS